MLSFVTLFNRNYLTRGLALVDSLERVTNGSFQLYIIAVDDSVEEYFNEIKDLRLEIIPLQSLYQKYPVLVELKKTRTEGEFCWTLSSFSIQYVLHTYELDACVYVDADIYFFSDPLRLIEEMDDASVLITEHNYSIEYDDTATSGKFCVQFMCFKNTPEGNKVLEWWRERCEEWCFNRFEDGKFGDQKYLDDWESRFEGVVYNCRNIGCGLAPWNCQKYEVRDEDGKYYVLDKVSRVRKPIVFYHYHKLRRVSSFEWMLSNYRLSGDVLVLYRMYISKLQSIEKNLPSDLKERYVDRKEIYERFRFLRSVYGGLKAIREIYNRVSQSNYNTIIIQ